MNRRTFLASLPAVVAAPFVAEPVADAFVTGIKRSAPVTYTINYDATAIIGTPYMQTIYDKIDALLAQGEDARG